MTEPKPNADLKDHPQRHVKYFADEAFAVDNRSLNEIRPLVSAIRFQLYGIGPSQAFIRSQA